MYTCRTAIWGWEGCNSLAKVVDTHLVKCGVEVSGKVVSGVSGAKRAINGSRSEFG